MNTDAPPLLDLRGARKVYRHREAEVVALDQVSLQVAANRVPTRMYSHVTGVAAGNPTCLAYQAGSSDIICRDGFQ